MVEREISGKEEKRIGMGGDVVRGGWQNKTRDGSEKGRRK